MPFQRLKRLVLILIIATPILLAGCWPGGVGDPDFLYYTVVEEYDAANDTVSAKAPMPWCLMNQTSAIADNMIHLFGSRDVLRYDVMADSWQTLGASDSPAIFCALNGKVYGVVDCTGLEVLKEYDPATNTWTRKADMQAGRAFPAVAAATGKLYVFGGWDENESPYPTECYDPAADSWSYAADMPTHRWNMVAETVNGKIYVIGGTASYMPVNTVEEYDPSTDTWSEKADIPGWSVRKGMYASCVAEGRIYIVFFLEHARAVNIYDPATDTWTVRAATGLMRRKDICYASADGKLFIMGGSSWFRGRY